MQKMWLERGRCREMDMKGQRKPRFRHAGILVKDLKQSIQDYRSLGFQVVDKELLRVVKMEDESGNMIELVKGNWHPHIAVNWYEDSNGNYVEEVLEK